MILACCQTIVRYVIPLIKLVKVPVGGYCKQDDQCHGSENSVCKHERCVCRDGYLLFNLECHEGTLLQTNVIQKRIINDPSIYNTLI